MAGRPEGSTPEAPRPAEPPRDDAASPANATPGASPARKEGVEAAEPASPSPPSTQPKNLETLDSLEEEMAKLLGRPVPRRDG